ncbi:FeoA family protein [Vibrio sp. WXL210]|uniref:FeoA family protein n=1 Tax=Vibrio sp. WXL210 TaxID=3450709 RepID=UPI003EC75EB1
MEKKLSQLSIGGTGKIIAHQSIGATRQRLLDLGLIPDTEISFIRTAPLGDPIEIRVGHTHIVVRKTEAETVVIKEYK